MTLRHIAKCDLAGTENIPRSCHCTEPHPNINWLSYHSYQLFSQWFVALFVWSPALCHPRTLWPVWLIFSKNLMNSPFFFFKLSKRFEFALKWNTGLVAQLSDQKMLSNPPASFSTVSLLPSVYFAFSLTRLLSPSISFLVQESATAPDPGQYDLTTSSLWLNLHRALCATS